MRRLTVKQKKFLIKWANDNTDLMEQVRNYVEVMDLEDWEKLQEMNDTEILFQNCNNFLNDLELKEDEMTGVKSYFFPK